MKYFVSFFSPILYIFIVAIWKFIKYGIWDSCCLMLGIYSANTSQILLLVDTIFIYIFYIGILLTVGILLFKKKWRYVLLFVVGSVIAWFILIFSMMYSSGDLCQSTPESYNQYKEELSIKCLNIN